MTLIKKGLSILLILLIFYSCKNELTINNKETDNYIPEYKAKLIAENIMLNDDNIIVSLGLGLGKQRKSKKKIKSTLAVSDDNDNIAYHIINYEGGGFIILSGDKRSEPILAFSENSEFNFDSNDFPSGLVGWLHNSKNKIQEIRDNELSPTTIIKHQWNVLLKHESKETFKEDPWDPNDPDNCITTVTEKGPYLKTVWNQRCGYNALLKDITCNENLPCGKPYTGCVATAMGQIMKYHEYPSRYNWSDMPNMEGTNSTALLMKDIGNAVNMDYKCTGSGANTKKEAVKSFKNDFNYSSASYDGYNYQTVVNELKNKRPVILTGGSKKGWWIFGQYVDGHAWVCDGYKRYSNCEGSILKLHMNWGWDNNSSSGYNGWYSYNNFEVADYTFNYKSGMVYNIKP